MAEFKIGGKIICVKDHPVVTSGVPPVFKGQMFTVRSMFNNLYYGNLLLRFTEIVGPINHCTGREMGYEAFCFLPLDDFKEVTFKEITKEVPVGAQ